MIKPRLNKMLNIKYPIILDTIPFVSDVKLVQAVSEAGGLGVLTPSIEDPKNFYFDIMGLKETGFPFGVKIPLDMEGHEDFFNTALEEKVEIVITSDGSPGRFIERLKESNCKLIHQINNLDEIKEVVSLGVDALIVKGYDGAGILRNARLNSMTLTSLVADQVKIPVFTAGAFADGRALPAAISLGADAVVINSRLLVTEESIVHENYKNAIINSYAEDTVIVLKNHNSIRLLRNKFTDELLEMEASGVSCEELKELLSPDKFIQGMIEGDTENGALIADQAVGLIKGIKAVSTVLREMNYEAMIITDQLNQYKPKLNC
ncbi:MAG: NAD(P)H-dependent flavin oxidoreductase [Vulcanimicrobiota bacterium]